MKQLQLFFLLLVSFVVTETSYSQSIFANTITGTNPNTTNPYIIGQTVSPNITVSGISRGAGITGTNANDRYNANGWSTGAIDLTDYFEFTLTPTSGYKIDFTDFVYTGQVSSGTPSFSFRSSVDGFTANIGAPSAVGTTIGLGGAAYQNISSAITFRLYAFNLATATTTYSINDFTFNGMISAIGIISAQNGDWYLGTTWVGGVVPTNAESAVVDHAVFATAAITRDAGTNTVINAGKSLAISGFTYTNNGSTSVAGTFELRTGGYAAGNNFNYITTTGTLNFNAGGNYGVNPADAFWPTTNGPANVNVLQGGITLASGANRVVPGLFTTASAGANAINFPAATLTLNGTCRIDFGGAFGNAPIFGNASTLIYNSTGTYGRGLEWAANGVGTIGVTTGYPNNLQISNGTTINYNNGTPSNKAIAGNLLIDAGSSLFLDFGPPLASNGDLTVAGNVTNNGNFTLADDVGDDLYLGGNFANTGVFNSNAKAIFFTKTGIQTVSSTNPLTISYIVQQPASGINTVQLLSDLIISAPSAGIALTFSNATDVFDLNGRNLTIGTAATANTILGAGTFKGSTTSNLSIIGNGSIGTIGFTTGFQNLGTFNIDRTAGAIACVLSSPVQINTALSLTNGIVDLGNNPMTIGATAGIINGSASNYIIADVANGANAALRKVFTAAGAFTFPIGDGLATANGSQYSPATLTFTGGTYGGNAGVAVDDLKTPNLNASVDYITRYWKIATTGITPTSYIATASYLPSDIVGTESNCISNQWNGTAWLNNGNNTGVNSLTVTATTLPVINHFTKGLIDVEINIRQGVTTVLHASTFSFGTRASGSTTDIVFTIQNLGQENLNLSAATITGNPTYSLFANYLSPVTGPTGTTTFTIRFIPPTPGTFTGSISIPHNDSSGAENPYIINFTAVAVATNASDLVLVAGSPATNISSTINDAVLTATTGVQVMNFTIRDGGATVDADNLSTTLTGFTISQSGTNGVANWLNAIQTISLFDGTSKLADGVVSATTIVFSGLSGVAADSSTKTLSLRLSLKCPLGAGVADGQDFGFSITNANTTFATTGSGKSAFAAVSNANSTNIIQVVATQLGFSSQPISTGVGAGMANVVVKATDLCGNTDLNFASIISLTSTGTMTGQPINITAGAGVATFIGIVHTVVGTNLTMTASATGVTNILSNNYDIGAVTVLEKGDLAILAVNTNNVNSRDEFSFVCFKDILPGTQIYFTDNGYERVTAGRWGDTEGVFSITRTGITALPKGTIVTIENIFTTGINDGAHFDVKTCGVIDANWTKSSQTTDYFNLNEDDQIWIMQGGAWGNLSDATNHNATYSGNVLYGWTEIAWKTAPAWDVANGTKGSTIFPGNRCYSTDVNNLNTTDPSRVKFDDPTNPDFSSTGRDKIDWIAVINDSANWISYLDNATYNAIAVNTNYDYIGNTTCPALTITAGTFVDGAWTGLKNTNWFNCNNWDTLEVPLATSNVTLASPKAIRLADISAIATDAALFGSIARCNNLTVSSQKVTLNGNANNKLEVNGNLIINGTGSIDMTDGNTATADGEISLSGNWTNSRGEGFFNEGEGTVIFKGTTTQNVTCALGTPENFYNVTLNNTFTTDNFNSDLIANGNLDIRPAKSLTVKSGHYAQVAKNLTVGAGSILEIEDDASLVQIDNAGVNSGTGTARVTRTTTPYERFDYTYWSSPIANQTFGTSGLSTWRMDYAFLFNTSNFQDLFGGSGYPQTLPGSDSYDDTGDAWQNVGLTTQMIPGKGYGVMAPTTGTFPATSSVLFSGLTNKLNTGNISIPLALSQNNADNNDDFNLVGNPYPSAIKANDFINANLPNITGTLYFWSHKNDISISNPGPGVYNFSSDDYAYYNLTGGTATAGTVGTGSNSGSLAPTGFIASGQGFMVESENNTSSLIFNNSMRSKSYNNTNFWRPHNSTETNRFWLNLTNPDGLFSQQLIGYFDSATLDFDLGYDGLVTDSKNYINFYSLVDLNTYKIQARPTFSDSDIVPIGYSSAANGLFTISIDNKEGILNADATQIFLKDNDLDIYHDLKASPYNFTTVYGTYNDRFEIHYTNPSLGITSNNLQNNSVVIISKNETTRIKSNLLKIEKVMVYDILGRELLNKSSVNEFEFSTTNTQWSKQALIVKVVLENGEIVTKKIVN